MVDGLKIRALREVNKMTTYEFAEKVRISQTMTVQIEHGDKQPSVAVLKRIADFFGLSVNDFIKEEI